MSYFHDVSEMCTVGGCTRCGTRWIAGGRGGSRELAIDHELRAHPGESIARQAGYTAKSRRR